MILSADIKKDRALEKKIAANDLNCIDCFKLAAAVSLTKLFPGMPVYLVPQQQTKPIRQLPPAIFVLTTEIHREKRFNSEHEYQIGVNIAYMSVGENEQTEQQDAAIKIMDMAESIPPLEGMQYPYTMYVTDSRTVDGIVNITGTVTVWERRPDDAPLIQEAETIVNIKEEEEHKNGCNEANSSRSVFTDHRR